MDSATRSSEDSILERDAIMAHLLEQLIKLSNSELEEVLAYLKDEFPRDWRFEHG